MMMFVYRNVGRAPKQHLRLKSWKSWATLRLRWKKELLIKTKTYFRKKLHLRCLIGFWIHFCKFYFRWLFKTPLKPEFYSGVLRRNIQKFLERIIFWANHLAGFDSSFWSTAVNIYPFATLCSVNKDEIT